MFRAKVPVNKIAVALGGHRSTIYRGIGRNRFVEKEVPDLNGFWGLVAQNKAVARSTRWRKRITVLAGLKFGGPVTHSFAANYRTARRISACN